MLEGVIGSLAAGVTYSLTAWGKQEGEPFDPEKFFVTLFVGVLVGAFLSVSGGDPGVAHSYLVGLGLVPLVENLAKLFYRKVLGYAA